MPGLSQSRQELLRAGLLGGILAAASILGFVGLWIAVQWVGHTAAGAPRTVDTAPMIRPLASVAIPAGVLIGLLAKVLQRGRQSWLIAAGATAYLLTSVTTTWWLAPAATRADQWLSLVGKGLWAALACALVAGPALIVAFVVLERLTRRPVVPSEPDEAPGSSSLAR